MTEAQRIARELVKRLLAAESLILSTPRSEDTIPSSLEAVLDIDKPDEIDAVAKQIGEILTDLDSVVDLFATDEEIAAIIRELYGS